MRVNKEKSNSFKKLRKSFLLTGMGLGIILGMNAQKLKSDVSVLADFDFSTNLSSILKSQYINEIIENKIM